MRLCDNKEAQDRLQKIRALYEPHAFALCRYLRLSLPLWIAAPRDSDSWRTVNELSSSPEGALRATDHISDQSVASHLHDEEHVL